MIKRVYIFIEVGYKWGKGLAEDKTAAFEKEIKSIFSAIGFNYWFKSMRMSALECVRNDEETLYCHPMDLVGFVHEDQISKIEDAIKQSSMIEFRYTKIYDMTEKDWSWLKRTIEKSKTASAIED